MLESRGFEVGARHSRLGNSVQFHEGEPRGPLNLNNEGSRRDKMAESKDAMERQPRMHVLSWKSCLLLVIVFSEKVRSTAPKIVSMKLLDDIEIGQRVSIVCTLKEGTPPISFSWRKDGSPLAQSNELKILHNDEFQENLQIAKITPDHVGNYTCSAKNSYGSDQMSVAVVPKYKPLWIDNAQKNVVGLAGQTVTLDCSAKGQPKPSISIWKGECDFNPCLRLAPL